MSAHAAFLDRRTFGSLDGLRALSIVAVVWHHSQKDSAWILADRGYLGVDLFFVLSGFLITTLLLRERAATGRIATGAFYARRALRIFPLYYAFLLGTVATAAVADGVMWSSVARDAPWSFLYLANWKDDLGLLALTWSLAAEEQFYCVWPWVERLLPRAAGLVGAAALLGIVAVQLLHAHAGVWPHAPRFITAPCFVPILLGVALAHLLHHPRGFAAASRLLGNRLVAPLALALVVLAAAQDGRMLGLPRLEVHVAMTALVGACVVGERSALAPLLRLPAVARVGAISYGIYLLHMPARALTNMAMADNGWHGPGIRFAGTMLLSLLFAELSFRWFEQPFLRWKQRFTRGGKGPAPGSARAPAATVPASMAAVPPASATPPAPDREPAVTRS